VVELLGPQQASDGLAQHVSAVVGEALGGEVGVELVGLAAAVGEDTVEVVAQPVGRVAQPEPDGGRLAGVDAQAVVDGRLPR
jgi:hypothetical protein